MESGLSQSGKKFCAVMGKAENFILSQGKLIFFENHYTTDERVEEAFQVICDWSQRCHYLIKKSFEQVENVSVLKIKWVEKQPGGRYHIYHFCLHLVWQGNGIFFIREFWKMMSIGDNQIQRSAHTRWHVAGKWSGNMLQKQFVWLTARIQKTFWVCFSYFLQSLLFFTKMISFFKQEIE